MALTRRVGPDASAAQIAGATIATWNEIDAALAPIIGQRGVCALYQRSLHLTRLAYPHLGKVPESPQLPLDVSSLHTVLANQTPGEAAAVSGAVLQKFYELLTQLIGASLTERLLRSVWASFLTGETNQDSLT